MARKSRLRKRIEKRSKRNLALTILIIVVFSFFFIRFGVPIFAQVGLFISGLKSSTEVKKEEKVFITPPVLNSLPSATNSAQIVVSGRADKDQQIKIYINGAFQKETETDNKGEFTTLAILGEKENSVKAKAFDAKENGSDFSQTQYVSYIVEPPKLELNSPSDGQKFQKDDKNIEVSGITDTGARVTVNDFIAVVDGEGNFSYRLSLKDGDNDIKITAVDEAGNKTEKTIKVSYSP